MAKVTLTDLKRHLGQRSHDDLVGDITDLFTRLDAVKDYYALRLTGPSEDLVAGYKTTIRNEFFPTRGYGKMRLAVARKAIADYKKLAPPAASVADLMLYYVEMGVQFTNTYGDINESFYSSMETMYERAARLIAAHGLRDEFETRCAEVVSDTRNIGWGFHDALADSYAAHFA